MNEIGARGIAGGREFLARCGPGLALSILVAVAAVLMAPVVATVFAIPAMVIALLLGIALNPLAARPVFEPGLA